MSESTDLVASLLEAGRTSDLIWPRLVELCDDIGGRLCGSRELERAIDWGEACFRADGHDPVWREEVTVPHWERGDESCELTAPVRMSLPMHGLGLSVGTEAYGAEGLEAPVVIVRSYSCISGTTSLDIEIGMSGNTLAATSRACRSCSPLI